MSALFVRLDAEIGKIHEELANVRRAAAQALAIEREAPALYSEWTHKTSVAAGLASIYTKIESVMEDIAQTFDGEIPQGDSYHKKLIDQMALPMPAIRPALLSAAAKELVSRLRSFRHVAKANYSVELNLTLVLDNLAAGVNAVDAFVSDYQQFRAYMLAPADDAGA